MAGATTTGVHAQLSAQQALTRVIAAAPPAEEAMPRLLEAVGRSFGWESGAYWAIAEDRCLRAAHAWATEGPGLADFVEQTRTLTLAPGEGLPGGVAADGQPAWVANVLEVPSFRRRDAARAAGLHAAVALPVCAAGRTLGVLEFFDRDLRDPDPALMETLSTLGLQVGGYLERRRIEDAVRESESLKSAILEAALDAIITMDHTGIVTEFNPAAERLFGYSREQAVGSELATLVIPEALRERHRAGLAHYLATGEGPVLRQRLELPALRADGSEFPVELTITPINHGGPPLFAGYVRDLSERLRAEATVRAMSTPILRIGRRLLLVPVVGAVDPERALHLREQLLAAIREERARAAVIDVTGMPEFELPVAEILFATVEAARLMGAQVILTGISAGLAATLVDVGADLAKISAVGDLQAGIEQVLSG